jgi:hypothetical protein
VFLAPGCPSDKKSSGSHNLYENPSVYFTSMSSLVVEVAYETGAEPATGTGLTGQPLWEFLSNNLGQLFQGRPTEPQIIVPTDLSQMKSLPDQGKAFWTAQDLVALANAERTGTSTAATGDFFVVFLNGYFEGAGGGADPNILGVQITGTSVLAVSKPAMVAAASGELPYVENYMEQLCLVHEMGHALGLVNYGIPQTSPHQDTAHGAHCTSTSCVMYWQNEGGSATRQFVLDHVVTGGESVYGTECLNDARQYAP